MKQQGDKEPRNEIGRLSRIVLFIEAYVLLILLDLGLHTMGLDKVCRLIHYKGQSASKNLPDAEVEHMSQIAFAAYGWYRPRIACLHRALTIYCLLRMRGIPAELCLGVKAHSFAAHSWVEYQDTILGDSPLIKTRYQVLKRIP